MQASRLLSILMLLQTRGRLSGHTLARTLEVSVRTIYRDIDELSAAGVPVWADRGRSGGFQLQDGWRTRLTGLTTTEAQALFMAGLPGPASELGLGDAMASAQLKVLAALPAGWETDAQRVSSRFHLDPVDWFHRATPPVDHLGRIASAVWNERRLALRYESWSGVSERIVEPLGLVLKAGTWYLAASSAGGEPRTYRVASVLALDLLDETFRRPPAFDLAAYWRDATQRFEASVYHDRAELRVSPRGLKRLAGFGAAIGDAAARSASTPDADGWVHVTIPVESLEHAAQQVLRLGTEAEALAPPALREGVLEMLARIGALYGAPTPPARAGSRARTPRASSRPRR